MMKNKTFKLLSKTTLIYLLFTFVAFFISAIFLTHKAHEFINRELEHYFHRHEHRIEWAIENRKDLHKIKKYAKIMRLTTPPELKNYPIYSDTTLTRSETEETIRFRKKTMIIEVDSKYYKISMLKPVEDFYVLRDEIFNALIPAFILLAISIVLFNYILSGYFFKPFNKILEQMRTYKVGAKAQVRKVATNTTEFIKMQKLFHQMVKRIEHDYQNLKEYTQNMAHEIQTPLAVMRNKTENMMSNDKIMKEHASTIKIMYDEINHLSKLGNTLNLITKIENDEFNNDVQIRSLPIITKHIEATSELAKLKSLTIETNLSDDHNLLLDSFLFDIILKNLLRNAIRYGTMDGPIKVETTSNNLQISNYGPPLDVPFDKLCERFYKNNGTQTSLGLGLSLVKKICQVSDLQLKYQYETGQHIFSITSK